MPASEPKPDDARRKALVRRGVIQRRYGICSRTLDNWVARKTVPHYKIGGLLLFKIEECDHALKRFKIEAK